MPNISFIEPQLLWLLLLLPLVWLAALNGPQRLSQRRRLASLGLRTIIVVALVFAIAGAQFVTPYGATTTMFLIDSSDSVALSQRARAEGFVQQALASMPADDQAGIIVFGSQALVERQPSQERVFGQVTALPNGSATDIAAALRLGTALLPAEGNRRIVLLSDGGETSGDALAEAQHAVGSGVPIDIIPLSGAADGIDAQIGAIELPSAARAGQRPQMRISLTSSAPVVGRLRVDGPGGTLVNQQIELPNGTTTLNVALPEPPPGFSRYVVRLEVEGDVRPENNAAEAFTFTTGRPRILIIEGAAGEAAQLAAALKAAGLETNVIAPNAAPRQIVELAIYDATVLVNVPRKALADETISALSIAVHDLGRGLMMVGGPQSFGAGSWRDTPLEAALPVTMDIPPILRTPPVSVVVLIDISGSMSQQENGRTKLSLALEGAQRIASLLRDEDELTVIPFDDAPHQVVGPLPGNQRDQAIAALEKVQGGGGGINIHDGLTEAAKYIRASTHQVRHIITLTDGDDTVQQEGALTIVEGLHSDGVTLTTIAIGKGKDVSFIESAAQTGGGRTFLTEQASNLPSLLVDETQAILKPYVVELDFTPALGSPHPALRITNAAPQLHGLVLTTPRATAQVLLAAPDGSTVLASWQYGLGRSLAWTSDLTGRWGKDWVTWTEFPRITAQLLAWLLPTNTDSGFSLEASTSGGVLALDARAEDSRGAPRSGLQVQAQLYSASGNATTIALREVSPGQYHATVGSQPAGAYLVQMIAADANGAPVAALTAGAVVPLSAEYRGGTANPALLEELARITNGRLGMQPSESFTTGGVGRGTSQEIAMLLLWAALALLPFDIAVRRLFWQRSDLSKPSTPYGRFAKRPNNDLPQEHDPKTVQTSQPTTSNSQPAPPSLQSSRETELARLREEQERARRRARGEE